MWWPILAASLRPLLAITVAVMRLCALWLLRYYAQHAAEVLNCNASRAAVRGRFIRCSGCQSGGTDESLYAHGRLAGRAGVDEEVPVGHHADRKWRGRAARAEQRLRLDEEMRACAEHSMREPSACAVCAPSPRRRHNATRPLCVGTLPP